MQQVCFIKQDYDRTVKPFWNDACHNLSDNLFLPYADNNKTNFTIHYLSSFIRKLTPVYTSHFPLSFKSYTLYVPDVIVKAVKKIRFYFNSSKQKTQYEQMMVVARRAYNLTVDMCNNGKYIDESGKSIDLRIPVRNKVREEINGSDTVFDANVCDQAVLEAIGDFIKVCNSNKKKKSKVSQAFNHSSYSKLGFKSRKYKKQTFTHPRMGKKGVCFDSLGKIKVTEKLPDECYGKNVKVTMDHGRWFICVQKHIVVKGNHLGCAESQGQDKMVAEKEVRVIALDPGSRTFVTGFNEHEVMVYGKDYSVKCLLPLAKKMRRLYSLREKLSQHKLYKKELSDNPQWIKDRLRYIEKNLNRLACKRQDRVNHLHRTVAYSIVRNYDVIYLPEYETKPMVKTKGRKIGRKAVHDMLSLSHYKFKEFLLWTAKKYGKEVIIVNESYTSKTQSWNGVVNEKLGSSRTMKDGTRIIDRDINGARNIYLKHVSQLTNN